jgi:hypothetical protein
MSTVRVAEILRGNAINLMVFQCYSLFIGDILQPVGVDPGVHRQGHSYNFN